MCLLIGCLHSAPSCVLGTLGDLDVAQQGAPVCTELPGCALQRG